MGSRIVKVTRNLQVSIPKDIAKALGIEVGDRLTVRIEGEKIIFERFMPLEDLAGILNPGSRLKGLAEQLDLERKRGER